MKRFLAALTFFLPSLAHADLQPGNWEMSVTTQFEGMPNAMGPMVQTQCFTAADVRDPQKVLGTAASGCEYTNKRDTGSEFTFDLQCNGQVQMQGSGRARYSPTTMEADVETRGSAAGQQFTTRSRISGRRLGAC